MEKFKDLKPVNNRGLSIIEIEHPNIEGEYIHWHVMHNRKFIIFGSICNSGFMPSFYHEKSKGYSLDEELQSLLDFTIDYIIENNEQPEGEIIF